MQILLALNYCHHPNGHGRPRSSSGGNGTPSPESNEKRAQILHRDLKPDNGTFIYCFVQSASDAPSFSVS